MKQQKSRGPNQDLCFFVSARFLPQQAITSFIVHETYTIMG